METLCFIIMWAVAIVTSHTYEEWAEIFKSVKED